MKFLLSRVPLLSLLLVASSLNGKSSKPEASHDDKVEIARLEERWLTAIETSDVKALDFILADDFVRPVPEASQFITKAQLIAHFKTQKRASVGSKRIENLAITLYGTTAIARGNVVNNDPNGQAVSRNLFTDVFVRRHGRWQAVSAQENDTIH